MTSVKFTINEFRPIIGEIPYDVIEGILFGELKEEDGVIQVIVDNKDMYNYIVEISNHLERMIEHFTELSKRDRIIKLIEMRDYYLSAFNNIDCLENDEIEFRRCMYKVLMEFKNFKITELSLQFYNSLCIDIMINPDEKFKNYHKDIKEMFRDIAKSYLKYKLTCFVVSKL